MTTDLIEEPINFIRGQGNILLIACGALAKEVVRLIELNGLSHLDVACLPAKLHHRPALIPEAVRAKIREKRQDYDKIYVLYGDCGTGGELDKVLEEEGGIERIAGPHCFSFFMGNEEFEDWSEESVTTFYLTDFFCRNFETFMWKAYGLDRREDMVPFIFGNYTKLLYLPQGEDRELKEKAKGIAERLGLDFHCHPPGFVDFSRFVTSRL